MSGAVYPLSSFISCDRFSSNHRSFLAAITAHAEPSSFKEAMEIKVWRDAMGSEINALERNHTWDLQELPAGKKALGNQWVFTIKYLSTGSIGRYKARLVVLGNHQQEGVDYTDTFSPR